MMGGRCLRGGSAFSGTDSLYNVNVTPSENGTVSIGLAENKVYDPAGNGNVASNTIEIYYDNLPPVVDVTDINEAGTLDTLKIEWQSTDVSTIQKHSVFVTNDNQNYSLLDTTAGDVFTYDWVVPNAITDQNRIAVEAKDKGGLVSADTTNIFAIVDNDPPVVTALEPTEGISIPEYYPLTVRWQVEDNIGVDSVKVFYSNDDGADYVLMGSLTDPKVDSLKFNIPIGATDKAKVKVVALDTQGNSGYDEGPYFTVTDNTPPTVSISNPKQNDQFEIGTAITVDWVGNDNVGISSVNINYSLDESTTWQEIVKNLTGLESHQWLAPNVITNNL
ncbi:MAG: hypothetical protein QF535_21140, partial [Anaerolineales bacterium]|nr:hypothetical protein [Anaerolineales bacterium]